MKWISTLIVCIVLRYSVLGQSKTVKKVVKNAKGETLSSTSVFIKGKKIETITSATNEYELINLPTGSYTILVSLIGYETGSKKIVTKAGEQQTVDFELKESSNEL